MGLEGCVEILRMFTRLYGINLRRFYQSSRYRGISLSGRRKRYRIEA